MLIRYETQLEVISKQTIRYQDRLMRTQRAHDQLRQQDVDRDITDMYEDIMDEIRQDEVVGVQIANDQMDSMIELSEETDGDDGGVITDEQVEAKKVEVQLSFLPHVPTTMVDDNHNMERAERIAEGVPTSEDSMDRGGLPPHVPHL
jgi:hypothetical protein